MDAVVYTPNLIRAHAVFEHLRSESPTNATEAAGILRVLIASAHAPTRAKFSAHLAEEASAPFAVHVVPSLQQAEDAARSGGFDIGVLDVTGEQCSGNGLRHLIGQRPAMVIVARNACDALAAFDYGAVDFLLRLAAPERIQLAIARALVWLNATLLGAASPAPEPVADNLNLNAGKRWVRAVRNGELISAPLDEAMYFQAERKLTRVVFPDTDAYLHLGINAVARHLDSQQFWRIHRSTIVNAKHVSAVRRDELGRVHVLLRSRSERLSASRPYERALVSEGLF